MIEYTNFKKGMEKNLVDVIDVLQPRQAAIRSRKRLKYPTDTQPPKKRTTPIIVSTSSSSSSKSPVVSVSYFLMKKMKLSDLLFII